MRKQVLRSLKRVSLLLLFVIFCFGRLQAGTSFKGHQKGAKQLEREEKESRSSYYAIASSQTLSLSNSDMFDLLRYAHKVNPSSLQTKNELSLYYFVLNPELAIQIAKESIKGDKGENYWYYDRLSDFLAIQDKDKETIELYDKMLQLFPKRRNDILEKKILFYTAKKEYLSAVRCCKDLELYKGECEELAFRKCNLYTKAGFLDSAVFEIDKLIKKYPSNATY
ncbi:MAG TPA: hypothetical protein DDY68_01310, partial [Porphyromonadaceae bacterium]|nr:hypothetical protein [Porphyromonadaceae bacterium]